MLQEEKTLRCVEPETSEHFGRKNDQQIHFAVDSERESLLGIAMRGLLEILKQPRLTELVVKVD